MRLLVVGVVSSVHTANYLNQITLIQSIVFQSGAGLVDVARIQRGGKLPAPGW